MGQFVNLLGLTGVLNPRVGPPHGEVLGEQLGSRGGWHLHDLQVALALAPTRSFQEGMQAGSDEKLSTSSGEQVFGETKVGHKDGLAGADPLHVLDCQHAAGCELGGPGRDCPFGVTQVGEHKPGVGQLELPRGPRASGDVVLEEGQVGGGLRWAGASALARARWAGEASRPMTCRAPLTSPKTLVL